MPEAGPFEKISAVKSFLGMVAGSAATGTMP